MLGVFVTIAKTRDPALPKSPWLASASDKRDFWQEVWRNRDSESIRESTDN